MTLDELIARLQELRKGYPELADAEAKISYDSGFAQRPIECVTFVVEEDGRRTVDIIGED
jgi:hypothetical protein